ncbi:MAG: hypothetical protein LC099_09015 [Anaerolineales bacterium]|nr:hypothetical protein [Anaerolineales bacterium]
MKRIQIEKIILIAVLARILFGASAEFYDVAWGTGVAVGLFSAKWFLLFCAFVLFCLFLYAIVGGEILQRGRFVKVEQNLNKLRNALRGWNVLLAAALLIFPVYFLQRAMWGVVFHGTYFRLLLWALTVALLSFILSRGESFIQWKPLLAALLLASSAFVVAVSLQNVTDYPFSLGWSEGNRIWDYSMMFGRERYLLDADQDVYVLLDAGRQFVGGVAFLLPNLSLAGERLWVGLTLILPYFFIGLAAYIVAEKDLRVWAALTLWIFIFLRQGPIHPPLILAAALTIFIWRKPLWLAVPLIIYAGYFAQASRFTWMFAPAIWIGTLELVGAPLSSGRLNRQTWTRVFALGFSGLFGGFLLPKILPLLHISNLAVADVSEQLTGAGATVGFVSDAVADQPLLWYRLLPNSTYGAGILLGALVAVLPTLLLLLWLVASKKWALNVWQKLAIAAPLSAFLAVGLIVSAKIGGGGDLHNLDMFLIGVAFVALLAWRGGGKDAILQNPMPTWIRLTLILSLIIPAFTPLMQLRSHDFGDQAEALKTLTDVKSVKELDMLPDSETIHAALSGIQEEVDRAKTSGDVLFIDQRQLLTFGYIQGVTLVPEYEKKMLMNEALSGRASYFAPFYQDLAARRFSLIVSEPLKIVSKDSSYQFGEENNAWVTWVSAPVLCYYQELQTYNEVNVMLLVPNPNADDCSQVLPH